MRTSSFKSMKSLLGTAVLGLALIGCDLEVPDLANPGLENLENAPTRASLAAATTGLIVGSRQGYGTPALGYVAQLGVIGRESFNFNGSDLRSFTELLESKLDPSSPFGGGMWTNPYGNIRATHIILKAADKLTELTDEESAGLGGFAKTLWALELMEVISTRDDVGVVIDTDHPVGGTLGAIVSKAEGLTFVASLLDEAQTQLLAGGDEFFFPLSGGFDGFDTPETFATFNRALRARVAAYQEDYQGILDALADSFIDSDATDVAGLEDGVYYSYGTGPGDTQNGLVTPDIFAVPSVLTEAEAGDARLARKTVAVDEEEIPARDGRTATHRFTMYTTPSSYIPIIRNEELILLRAEANWGLMKIADAATDLNTIRTVSAELPELVTLTTEQAVEDELLHSRRYSLLYEGHRWVDLRRFNRLSDMTLNKDTDVINSRYAIPTRECDGRPDEPRCELTSQP